MTTKPIDDGGPAFPAIKDIQGLPIGRGGMALRDYFAIHGDQPGKLEIASAAGVLLREHSDFAWQSKEAQELPTFDEWFHRLPQSERLRLYATVRYQIADAMLAARAEGCPQ